MNEKKKTNHFKTSLPCLVMAQSLSLPRAQKKHPPSFRDRANQTFIVIDPTSSYPIQESPT